MKVFVSIIIPVYKDWNLLKTCLSALSQQTYGTENFEIIIVNNDAEYQIPESFVLPPNCRVIVESKPGSYAARNLGLKSVNGEIIGFTDSDCIPDVNWISNAVAYLEKNKNYSRVAGPVKIIQKASAPTVIEKYNQIYSFPQKWLIENGGGSVTANLFVYKSVFDAIGGFDDKLMSMGDRYWGMKAESSGYKIAYLENLVVFHPPRNFKELVKKEKRHGGAITLTAPKHPVKLYLEFLYDCRPRQSGLRFMLGRSKDRRLIDRLLIPILRHYLMLVRKYESLKIILGKKSPSRS